jgi:glucose-6-phosphate 1-epimerase
VATFEPIVVIRSEDGASADIHRHGAHVMSWRPVPDGEERLFLSSTSEFAPGAAIRGGVPVIFPQFAAEGPLPRHGFARTMSWGLGGIGRASNGMAEADFVLRDSNETHAIWDTEFVAIATIRILGDQLAITLSVENIGEAPFTFTAALHTYLRVSDVQKVAIIGLKGAKFRVAGDRALILDDRDQLRIDGPIDRVYVDAPSRIELRDAPHSMLIQAEGFPDAVVWNPGAEAAASLTDLEAGGEKRFVCIEAAVIDQPVVLGPRRRWTGTQTLTAR